MCLERRVNQPSLFLRRPVTMAAALPAPGLYASTPLPAPPLYFNLPSETAKAFKIYQDLKKIQSSLTKTDNLAKAIFDYLDSNHLLYDFNIPNYPKPFQIQEFKEKILLGPFDVLPLLPRWNCLVLINENNFRFYFKKQDNLLPFENSPLANEKYFAVFSTTCFVHHLKMHYKEMPEENYRKVAFYHCCPDAKAAQLRQAPFHHEAQPEHASTRCGMHALNAYMGYHFFFFEKLIEMLTPGLAKGEDPRAGLSAGMLLYLIEKVARLGCVEGVTRKAKLIACTCKPSALFDNISKHEENLIKALSKTDRFILGLSKSNAHFLAYRKDEKGMWWKIDSMLNIQEAYDHAEALLADIKASYSNDHLQFIIPDCSSGED